MLYNRSGLTDGSWNLKAASVPILCPVNQPTLLFLLKGTYYANADTLQRITQAICPSSFPLLLESLKVVATKQIALFALLCVLTFLKG